MECKKLDRQENINFNCKKWRKEEVVAICLAAVEEAELTEKKFKGSKE